LLGLRQDERQFERDRSMTRTGRLARADFLNHLFAALGCALTILAAAACSGGTGGSSTAPADGSSGAAAKPAETPAAPAANGAAAAGAAAASGGTAPAGASAAGGAAASGSGEILIGHYGSLTGSEATFGKSTSNGVRLAIEEFNGAGGLGGRKISLKEYDTQ